MNLDSIREMLPETTFRIFAGDDNPFVNTMEMRGIGLKRMYASFATSSAKGIESKAYLYGLYTDSLRLDTINFNAVQDSTGIILTGGVKAGKTKKQEAFGITLNGEIRNDNASLIVRYNNEKGETGAHIGLKSVLRKRGISLHVIPENPILVYRKFNLNPENYIADANICYLVVCVTGIGATVVFSYYAKKVIGILTSSAIKRRALK